MEGEATVKDDRTGIRKLQYTTNTTLGTYYRWLQGSKCCVGMNVGVNVNEMFWVYLCII